jgi:histidinol-phosphate aminotransferase
MRMHGVLLRDRSADPGCAGFVRITIGVEEHVTRGLEALKAALSEIGWSKKQVSEPAGPVSGDEREFE